MQEARKQFVIIENIEVGQKKKDHNGFRIVDENYKRIPNNNKEDRWVDPIRSKEDVEKIKDYLYQKIFIAKRKDTRLAACRNYLLFVIGINVGLRVSDLISLRWDKIFEPDMSTFVISKNTKEKKTEKMKDISPNKPIKYEVEEYLKYTGIVPKSGEFIFLSARKNSQGIYQVITDAAVEKMIKDATGVCGLIGNYNTHSLRKTYAYHKYMYYLEQGDPLALVKVQKDLNHRNSSDTARYLGITRDEKIKSSIELGEYWGMW